MCGIVGAIDLVAKRSFDPVRLEAMAAAIAHRGPDDQDTYHEPGVALAARRLAIVDLSGGRQPIRSEDGSIVTAFNGELFDYPEIRQWLLTRGHVLHTRCDTEAWIGLYREHGLDVFSQTTGQFATAIWDRSHGRLLLGRDRLGICPLYTTEVDGWLLWSSEIKALLASGLVSAEPDRKGIDHLFHFIAAGTTRTFFEGISSLAPGHFLRVEDGRVSRHLYWDLDFPDRGQERVSEDPTPLIDELDELMEQSVRRRLHGDVPVVNYISGGLDSTVVLGYCQRLRGGAPRSFTIGFSRGSGPDEQAEAAESAAALGAPLTTLALDRGQIAEAYPELIRAAEGPVLDTSCAALLRLAQEVHQHQYKVVLTGEGADEAMAGYVWFKAQAIRDRLVGLTGEGLWRSLRSLVLGAAGDHPSRRPPQHAFKGIRPAQQEMYELFAAGRSSLYAESMWERLGDHDAFGDLDLPTNRLTRWHPLNQSLYVGYKVMLPGLLMIAKGDRIAMNASVETRYPFLDEDVVAFCASLAPEYKLGSGLREKWLLRQVAERMLPRAIARRPKTMFRARMAKTFLEPGRPAWVDELLSPESLQRAGYFDPDGVAHQCWYQARMPRITPARGVFDIGLTCVVATQLWHHIYCGGGLCSLPTWEPPRIRHDATGVPGSSTLLSAVNGTSTLLKARPGFSGHPGTEDVHD